MQQRFVVPCIAVLGMSLSYVPVSQGQENVIEEIIVTTQKRTENLRNVPLAVTAFTQARLSALGLNQLDVLSELTPGFVAQQQSVDTPNYVIRGLGADDAHAYATPRVSVYLNGADVSRLQSSTFELFDLAQIEVAKGPQATLFGTAASIGAVAITTHKAEAGTSASLGATVGNYSAKQLTGFYNQGTETLAGRIAFSLRERDGYVSNIAGQPGSQSAGLVASEKLQGFDHQAWRLSMQYKPVDLLRLDLIINYEQNDDSGSAFKSAVYAPTGGDLDPYGFIETGYSGPLALNALGSTQNGITRDIRDSNFSIRWDMNDTLTLTSISDYRETTNRNIFDADGSQAVMLQFGNHFSAHQFSQEFRLNYSGDRLKAVSGVNYLQEKAEEDLRFVTDEGVFLQCLAQLIPGVPCLNPDGSVNSVTALQSLPDFYNVGSLANRADNKQWSVFADGTYSLNDRTELTLGLRYIKEDKISGAANILPPSALLGAPLLPGSLNSDGVWVNVENDFSAWLPRISMLYNFNDQLNFYATISKGRRSPVLNVEPAFDATGNLTAQSLFVPAEEIWNYELGMKASMLDARWTLNAALFQQKYEDFQISIFDQSGRPITRNAGSANNTGVELESRYLFNDSLELFASSAWLDAMIDDKANNGIFAGNRFRLQPRVTASAGLLYNTVLNNKLSLHVRPVVTYRSDVHFLVPNIPIAGIDLTQSDITQVNLRVGLAANDDTWSLTAFGTNLTDKRYLIDAGNGGAIFDNPTYIPGPPRFYGIEGSWNF